MNHVKMNNIILKFSPHTVLKYQHRGNQFSLLLTIGNPVYYTTTAKYIQPNHKHTKTNINTQCTRFFSSDSTQPQQHNPQSSHTNDRYKRWTGILLFLSCAAYTAYLGTWQVQRKEKKVDAINDRTSKLYNSALSYDELIESIDNTNNQISSDQYRQYEYNSIVADGIFDYNNQYYIGPRAPPSSTNDPLSGKPSTLIEPNSIGYYIITPFKTVHGNIILVNRGWVPKKLLDSNNVPTEQRYSDSNGIVHVNGVLRTTESKPKYLSNNTNKSNNNELIYIDLPYIASQYTNNLATNTLYIEMNNEHKSLSRSDIYPIRKQKSDLLYFATTPLIHTVYAGTWFTLSGILTVMTYIRFFKR